MTDETHDDSGIGEDTSQGGGSDPLHGQGGEGREKDEDALGHRKTPLLASLPDR